VNTTTGTASLVYSYADCLIMITESSSSTSVLFKAGQPPAKARREIYHAVEVRDADFYNALEKRSPLPSYLTAFASSAVSSACQCLSVPTLLTTVKSISTATSTKSVPYPVKTRTVYRKFNLVHCFSLSIMIWNPKCYMDRFHLRNPSLPYVDPFPNLRQNPFPRYQTVPQTNFAPFLSLRNPHHPLLPNPPLRPQLRRPWHLKQSQ